MIQSVGKPVSVRRFVGMVLATDGNRDSHSVIQPGRQTVGKSQSAKSIEGVRLATDGNCDSQSVSQTVIKIVEW